MKFSVIACIGVLGAIAGSGTALGQAGSLDITFNPGTGANNEVQCIAVQTNGQILVGGQFTYFNGNYSPSFARLNPDGSFDPSFGPVIPGGIGLALAVQPDGKIVVGDHLRRLRQDGSVDLAFATALGTGPNGNVMAVVLQPDGNILCAGNFEQVNGTNRNCIARIKTTGALDQSFDPGASIASGFIGSIALQTNGQVVIAGNFTAADGTNENYVARLKTDGTMDTNFNAVIANAGSSGSVLCLVITPQDQIVVGGYFMSINGYLRNYIARLNSDGSLDTTFKPGLGPDFLVNCMALQADGKIVIGGGFTHYGPTYRPGLARLNTDGSLDTSFDPGAGAPNAVLCLLGLPSGKTLVGGTFTTFNQTNINYIARLNGDLPATTNLQFMAANSYFGTQMTGTISNVYRIEWTYDVTVPSLWTPLSNVTLKTNPQFFLDPTPETGQRFYRAVQIVP